MPTIQNYRAFVAVMDAGSVTAASQTMGRTQPQVSRLVAGLEEELGFILFDRRRQRLIPTERGARLYEEVKRALDGVDNLGAIASQIAGEGTDILRVLAPTYVAHSFLPAALARFSARMPGHRVSVEIVGRNSIGSWISFHPFDVGVAALPFERPSIEVERFAVTNTVVVLPKRHRLLKKREISVQDLDGEAFVTLGRNTPLRQKLDDIFEKAGVVPRVVVETSSSNSACELAAHGLGFTIVDSIVALPRIQDLQLVLKPWRPGLVSEFGFIYPAATGLGRPASVFVRAVKEVIAETHSKSA